MINLRIKLNELIKMKKTLIGCDAYCSFLLVNTKSIEKDFCIHQKLEKKMITLFDHDIQ